MKVRTLSVISILLSFALIFTACASSAAIGAAELSEGIIRKATEKPKLSRDFTSAATDFSISLFKNSLQKKDIEVLSPLSAELCLAMIANGADKNTLAQIEKGVGMKLEELNKYFYSYFDGLYSDDNCRLRSANSLWLKNDISSKMSSRFLQDNADWYGAQIYSSDFGSGIKGDVNNWVKKYTDGMIDSVLDEAPSANTVMLVLNSLVFDAKWKDRYESSDISQGEFVNIDGSKSNVNMMHSEEYSIFKAEDAVGFKKDYSGGRYGFVGVLPSEDTGIYDYVQSLSAEKWNKLWNSFANGTADVVIPEFEYTTELTDLTQAFKSMGMTDMFSQKDADFSRMTQEGSNDLYCSYIKQKVRIEVNRNGTKAAAVTVGGVETKCVPAIVLDRPFLFAVADNETGIPLFIGTVTRL